MEEPEDVEATSQSSSHLKDQEDWQVIEYLLQEAGGEFAKHLRNGSGINKDLLMGLGVVFGTDTLDAALELIDRKAVTQVSTAESSAAGVQGRKLFKVRGTSGMSYTILCPMVNRCSCKAWAHSTWFAGSISISKGTKSQRVPRLTCKHVLAVLISDTICKKLVNKDEVKKVVHLVEVTEETFVDMLATMD